MSAYASDRAGRKGRAIHAAAVRALGLPKGRVWIDYDAGTGFRVEVYAPLGSVDRRRIEALVLWLEGHVHRWQVCQNRTVAAGPNAGRWRTPVILSDGDDAP